MNSCSRCYYGARRKTVFPDNTYSLQVVCTRSGKHVPMSNYCCEEWRRKYDEEEEIRIEALPGTIEDAEGCELI